MSPLIFHLIFSCHLFFFFVLPLSPSFTSFPCFPHPLAPFSTFFPSSYLSFSLSLSLITPSVHSSCSSPCPSSSPLLLLSVPTYPALHRLVCRLSSYRHAPLPFHSSPSPPTHLSPLLSFPTSSHPFISPSPPCLHLPLVSLCFFTSAFFSCSTLVFHRTPQISLRSCLTLPSPSFHLLLSTLSRSISFSLIFLLFFFPS